MYRSDDGAAFARANAAWARWESAETTLRALSATADRVRKPREATEPHEAMSATELLLLSERLLAESIDLERELAVARKARASSAKARASSAKARASSAKAPQVTAAAPAFQSSPLGATLARHAALAARLRLIAPLIVAARAGREEKSIEPSSLLERRPSTRGVHDPKAVAELADRIDAQCDAVAAELERIGLARATGHWQERAHEALLVRTLLAEMRYERAARRLEQWRSTSRLPRVADLTGLESQADLEARLALLEEGLARASSMAAPDDADVARAVLAERWARYSNRILALAPSQRATLEPLPVLADIGDRDGIDRGIAAISAALLGLPQGAPLAPGGSVGLVSPDATQEQRDLGRSVSFLELVAGAFGGLLFGLVCFAVFNMLLPRPRQPNFVWSHAWWGIPLATVFGVVVLYRTTRAPAAVRANASPNAVRVAASNVVPAEADEDEPVEDRQRTSRR